MAGEYGNGKREKSSLWNDCKRQLPQHSKTTRSFIRICVLLTVRNLIWYFEHRGGTARHQVFVRSWYGCFSVTTTSTGNLSIWHKIRLQLDSISIEMHCKCMAKANTHTKRAKKISWIFIIFIRTLRGVCTHSDHLS